MSQSLIVSYHSCYNYLQHSNFENSVKLIMKENSLKDAATDPWGENETSKPVSSESLSFEDSFIEGVAAGSQERRYVPLEDSEQYLAGLERKLARVQGKTLLHRESERKRLIADLVRSREDHAINLLSSASGPAPCDNLEDVQRENRSLNKGLSLMNTVDLQDCFSARTLGLMMRKCAPNHVALSAEELCELLKSDILAKIHDDLVENEDNRGASPEAKSNSTHEKTENDIQNSVKDT